MVAADVPRLADALDDERLIAERAGLVGGGGERIRLASDETIIPRHSLRRFRPACLRALDAVAAQDRLRLAERGGIGDGRAGADILGTIADDVGNGEAGQTCGPGGERQAAALEPGQMAPDAVDLA